VKGLTSGGFFTAVTLAVRSYQGSCCAKSAPAMLFSKVKISSLSGVGIVHEEELILRVQDAVRNLSDCKARSWLSHVSHSDVLCSHALILQHWGIS